MKKLTLLAAFLIFLFSAGTSMAAISWTISPSPSDLNDLAHTQAALWGINATSLTGTDTAADPDITGNLYTLLTNALYSYQVTAATLKIKNITNNMEPETNDHLYIRLLDNNAGISGTTYYTDNQASGNYFSTYTGTPIADWSDTNGAAATNTLSYSFSDLNLLATLTSYIKNNGYFGLGFDPDCHYTNCGITLALTIEQGLTPQGGAVPEPATMVLFGTGLLAFAGATRKQFSKKGCK